MCGRFNLIDSPEIQWLCQTLGISLFPRFGSPDIAPGARIAIIHQRDGQRVVSEAIWWAKRLLTVLSRSNGPAGMW